MTTKTLLRHCSRGGCTAVDTLTCAHCVYHAPPTAWLTNNATKMGVVVNAYYDETILDEVQETIRCLDLVDKMSDWDVWSK